MLLEQLALPGETAEDKLGVLRVFEVMDRSGVLLNTIPMKKQMLSPLTKDADPEVRDAVQKYLADLDDA